MISQEIPRVFRHGLFYFLTIELHSEAEMIIYRCLLGADYTDFTD